jgi:AcrR family transcriptional regulator
VPTGVALRDARQQLFAAAERVLLREGPSAVTSRAVTAEAGCAKGVLHRHFADFDVFLAELVQDRIGRMSEQSAVLRHSAGTGSVARNLTGAVTSVFESIAVAIVGLVVSRDALRAQLRPGTPTGVPLLSEAAAMIASYLSAERELGRIVADADTDTLGLTLIGAGHLLFAGQQGAPPEPDAVRNIVTTVIADVVRPPHPFAGVSPSSVHPNVSEQE